MWSIFDYDGILNYAGIVIIAEIVRFHQNFIFFTYNPSSIVEIDIRDANRVDGSSVSIDESSETIKHACAVAPYVSL